MDKNITMFDHKKTIQELKDQVKDAVEERQALIDDRQEIEDELADVMIALLAFSNMCSIDLSSAVDKKVAEICKKYPVEKAKGKNEKYTKL